MVMLLLLFELLLVFYKNISNQFIRVRNVNKLSRALFFVVAAGVVVAVIGLHML